MRKRNKDKIKIKDMKEESQVRIDELNKKNRNKGNDRNGG